VHARARLSTELDSEQLVPHACQTSLQWNIARLRSRRVAIKLAHSDASLLSPVSDAGVRACLFSYRGSQPKPELTA
jgi:hypothetical protein